MTAASANLAFERAAALRDKLDSLTWLSAHLRHVREASRHSFVYPVRGHDDKEWWYLIHGGRVCAVVPSPSEKVQPARSGDATTRSVWKAIHSIGAAGSRRHRWRPARGLVVSPPPGGMPQYPGTQHRPGAGDAVSFGSRLNQTAKGAEPFVRRLPSIGHDAE